MTIDEFKKDKKELGKNIEKLIFDFENKYSVCIQDLAIMQDAGRNGYAEFKRRAFFGIIIKTEL